MKKLILGVLVVLAVISLVACGNNNNSNLEIDNNSLKEIETEEKKQKQVISSLSIEREWIIDIPSFSEDRKEIIYNIFGKYAEVGGYTFNEDGTFLKSIGINAGSGEPSNSGVYMVDTEKKSITFVYNDGSSTYGGYEMLSDGRVSSFTLVEKYEDKDYNIKFVPNKNGGLGKEAKSLESGE